MINLSIRWCVLIRSVRLWFDLDFYLWKEEKKQSLWKHISYILNIYIIKIWFQFIFSLLKNVKWLEWMESQCHDGFIRCALCDAAFTFRAISREQDAFSKCHLPFNWDQLAWKKSQAKENHRWSIIQWYVYLFVLLGSTDQRSLIAFNLEHLNTISMFRSASV